MPKALITLPDVYESVTRRVAVDVAAQLARTMRLPGDTHVYLPGNTETVPMNGGAFGDCCDPGVRYPAEAHLVMRFNEEVDEAHTLVTPVNKPEHRPLFHDPVRGVTLRPVYRYVTVTASMEYTAPSVVVAQRWIDEMRSRISMLRAELYQTLEYHYGIPRPVTQLLKHLHETMETSQAPTGDDFDTYVNKYLMQPTTTATTLIGTEPISVVPEKQYEVLGWFDFTTTPNTPERRENGTYVTSLTYTLHYNRPMQLFCDYPMLVHNKPVGRLYRLQEPYEGFKGTTRRVSTTKGSFDGFQRLLEVKGVPYIHYPDTDDWIPDNHPKGRLTFFSGLLMLSTADKRTLIDLYNLGDFTFTPYFLEYFFHQGNRVFDNTRSVFEFRLYENHQERTDIQLSFKPGSVTVVANADLDLTKYYHIQISLRRNWYQVNSDTLQELRRYPVVCYTLLRALGVVLGDQRFADLKLLGSGQPPRSGIDAQCTLLRDPTQGGTWPWPWLGTEWADIAWPGNVWEGSGWPGGGWEETPWPGDDPIPTWPGDTQVAHNCGGEVTNRDLLAAVEATDDLADNYIDRRRVGPLLVLYSQILSRRRSTR